MTTEQAIGLVLTGIVTGGGIVFALPKARSDWFSGTRSLVDLQAQTIEKLQARINELESKLAVFENHIKRLEAQYAASRVCTRARHCSDFTPPAPDETE